MAQYQRRSQNSHMSSAGDLSHMNHYRGKPGRPVTKGKAGLAVVQGKNGISRGQRISNNVSNHPQ